MYSALSFVIEYLNGLTSLLSNKSSLIHTVKYVIPSLFNPPFFLCFQYCQITYISPEPEYTGPGRLV